MIYTLFKTQAQAQSGLFAYSLKLRGLCQGAVLSVGDTAVAMTNLSRS